jgi:DNA-binding NarL/FixJ family response regulator
VIRVVLADDEPVVRRGFRMILESEADMTVVGEAGDGGRAVELAASMRPDVALLDVQMPGTDGLAAAREILERDLAARVVMLTTFDLDEYVYSALHSGVHGFLLKSIEPDAMVDAVRNVVAGHLLVAPPITRRLVEAYVSRHGRRTALEPLARSLSPRELDVVRLIARGLPNGDIARRLFLSEATVKTHVARILAKLALRDRTQVVVFAYEAGLVVAGDPATD